MLVSATAAAQAPACKLLTDEHGLWPLPNCEVIDHRPKISADTLKALNYDDHGTAVVYADQGFHYVDRKGRSLPVLTWDNGPETPQEGLLRARVGNRVGYFDLTFRQVVPGTFDFAWPFGMAWPRSAMVAVVVRRMPMATRRWKAESGSASTARVVG